MSFADCLLEPPEQAPVLGKDGGKRLTHMIGAAPEPNVKGHISETTLSFLPSD